MSWLLSRLFAVAVFSGLGGAIGYVVGRAIDATATCVLLGVLVGVGVITLRDSLRGFKLIQWLSGSQDTQAPRDGGFWGELAYRVERAIRKREKRIQRERNRLEQFLSGIEASPNGVMMLDANDQIEWCNSVSAAHFGLDPERDKRQRITNLVRSPAFVNHMQSGRYQDAVRVPDLFGRGVLNVHVRPYGDGQKLILSQDITERERADTMRRDFVANVSHEIRTPLTVLSGFIETMADLPLTEVERQRVLLLMGQQAHRIQSLVSDLLTLAQIEGSPRPPSDHWISMAGLFSRLQSDAIALSGGRHSLSFQPQVVGEVAGNETELLSAFANLVTNAVRYTPDGGSIHVSWQRRGDGVGVFAVRDTGLGIAREHIPRLAERFYRVDGSRSRDTGGTGLGLSIVKHVVQRHGGELRVDSELGKGSTFTLEFPAPRIRCVETGDTSLSTSGR